MQETEKVGCGLGRERGNAVYTWHCWGHFVLDGLKKTGELSWQEPHCLYIVFGYRDLCMYSLFRKVL
jgi:hypothetical protein